MKRKGMGDAALRAVEGRSGDDVLAALSGGEPAAEAAPAPKPTLVARSAEAPAKAQPVRALRSKPASPTAPAAPAPAPAAAEEKHVRYITASVQLLQEQIDALQLAAFKRKQKRGGGRADHSAIMRELVDKWIAEGGE